MGTNNVIFLEVIEWFDETGREILKRIPAEGSGEIKFGAQLIARTSQVGVFFYNGKAVHAFPPGRHTLKTANIPILTKILSVPWGMTSPLRAEVYFLNMKVFPNLKWGTREPVAFRDKELGLIRLRAFGVYNIRIVQPLLFINTMAGTMGRVTTDEVEDYLGKVIVSRLNDYMGEHLDTVLDLPGRYDQWSDGLRQRLREDFSHFGIALTHLYINSITPPPEVQQAIDDRSKLAVFDNLNDLMRLKAAMALEKAAENPGEAGGGMGMGMGLMLPGMMGQIFQAQGKAAVEFTTCPDCSRQVPEDAQFCPFCGHQVMVFHQCQGCGKNLPPNARFCSRCGQAVTEGPRQVRCPACGTDNLPGASFCNACGGRIEG
ncbi:MAG: SPFH domain-containing protein [Deltaproteobacteria bacterium]|nr:SPFH domain-containing protein [Deltaproteobacteria bacterium]